MTAHPQRIAIYGGSFDPIHVAHLILAQTAVEELNLDRLIFMPSGGKAHYKADSNQAPGIHRLRMIQLAVGEHPRIEVSDFEVSRTEFVYTVDTLRHFREINPPGTEIHLLAGGDWKDRIVTWKDGDVILREFKVALFPRPGFADIEEFHDGQENMRYIRMPLIDISSTDIRRRVREGLSIHYRVPEPVREYIRQNRLYLETNA